MKIKGGSPLGTDMVQLKDFLVCRPSLSNWDIPRVYRFCIIKRYMKEPLFARCFIYAVLCSNLAPCITLINNFIDDQKK